MKEILECFRQKVMHGSGWCSEDQKDDRNTESKNYTNEVSFGNECCTGN